VAEVEAGRGHEDGLAPFPTILPMPIPRHSPTLPSPPRFDRRYPFGNDAAIRGAKATSPGW
jgi:hypothetical protein